MRTTILSTLLLLAGLVVRVWAADDKSTATTGTMFVLPEIGEKSAPSRFSAAQVGYVQSWIRQLAPECPPAITAAVAEDFLVELQQRHPDKLDRLLTADFPSRTFASMLLRHVGTKLTGAASAPLREKFAGLRVAALLAVDTPGSALTQAEIAGLLAKVRDSSAVQHRRLLEGRLEDDELLLLIKKVRQPGAAPRVVAPVQPKVLTAAEIVSEFSRRNQSGAALPRLQAYTVEGKISGAAGEELDLLLFKMRPDRFRLVLRKDGITRSILAADGERFWQHLPGQAPQLGEGRNMGPRRNLGEFIDPLFVGDGYQFERLPDGTEGDRKFHRIAVGRADGSKYVAQIDTETFRETGRENEDGSTTRYSDFREVAGLTLAYREEATDAAGRKSVLVLTRITPNPGLMREFFQPPGRTDLDYFKFEKIVARAPTSAGPSVPLK